MAQTSTASCPHCRGRIASDPRLAGQVVKCPHCQKPFRMPSPTAVPVQWFVARDRQKHGPFTFPQLQQMAGSGSIQPADMLLPEGEGAWVRADTISGLFPGKQEGSLIPCESCGRLIATAAEACPGCGAPNQWVHPEIRRFLQAVRRFSRTPPASYGHVASRLWGNTDANKRWHGSEPDKGKKWRQVCEVGTKLSAGCCFIALSFFCCGFMGNWIVPSFVPVVFVVSGVVSMTLLVFTLAAAAGEPVESNHFQIDFGHTPPKWTSSNDKVWAEVKAFFFPDQRTNRQLRVSSDALDDPAGKLSDNRASQKISFFKWLLVLALPSLLIGCPLAGLVVYLSGGGGNVGRKSTTEQVSFEQIHQDDREAKNSIEDALDEFERVTDDLNLLYQRKALEEETQPDFKDRIKTMDEIESLLKRRNELGEKIDKLLKEELIVADSLPPERFKEMTQKIDATRNWQSRWKRASLRTR